MVTSQLSTEAAGQLAALRSNLESVIYGKSECIETLVIALLAGGSVLIEDVPGVGKTTLAKALAKSVDAQFHRIQFTPDLLPADILGSSLYNPRSADFEFRRGPIFCNIVLADEINRASPRTQSAMLEAMNEHQVTIDGQLHELPSPFLVLATQNPVDFHGTYPLPESQLDRFCVMLDMGYPEEESEIGMLENHGHTHPLAKLQPVVTCDEVTKMQQQVRQVKVDRSVCAYIVQIAQATRDDPRLKLGVSPRGALMMNRASQAAAFAAGRDYVLPDDVQFMSRFVLPHRLILTSKSNYDGTSRQDIITDVLASVSVPT